MQNPDPLDFVDSLDPSEVTPDFFVGFDKYLSMKKLAATFHTVTHGETVPLAAVYAEVCEQFGIDIETMRMWAFAGSMIAWDREDDDDDDFDFDDDEFDDALLDEDQRALLDGMNGEVVAERLNQAIAAREAVEAEVAMLREMFDR